MVKIKKIPDTGLAALILIGFILVTMIFIWGGVEIEVTEDPPDNRSNYKGSSDTLKRLNPGLPDCGACVKNCQWTLLKSLEECQSRCIPEETCLDPFS
jgi:hypothetical protein